MSQRAKDYQQQISAFANPDRGALPLGWASNLYNFSTGKLVHYDDCAEATGTVVDAKGPGYAALLKLEPARETIEDDWLTQSMSQVQAAGARHGLPSDPDEGWYAPRSWITYVPPSYAGSVDVTGLPHVEHLPDGGLLLSATDTFFNADNPAHVAAAHRMAKALQHLNDKPPVR